SMGNGMTHDNIIGWPWDGAVYCDECMHDDDKQPEAYEGIGEPIIDGGERELPLADCCAGCRHTLACKAGVGDCFKCEVASTTAAVQAVLAKASPGAAAAVLRALQEPVEPLEFVWVVEQGLGGETVAICSAHASEAAAEAFATRRRAEK